MQKLIEIIIALGVLCGMILYYLMIMGFWIGVGMLFIAILIAFPPLFLVILGLWLMMK